MLYIERHIETLVEKISSYKGVLIITGSRQVGKSTMLSEKFTKHEYITLDSPRVYMQAKEAPSAFIKQSEKLIIDEIQKAPYLFEYIKEDIDKIIFQRLNSGTKEPFGKYILTGSQSFGLMKGVTESLAGRAAIIQMCGLSKREINKSAFRDRFMPTKEQLKAKENSHQTKYNYKSVIEIIHKGSFPELYCEEYDLSRWTNFYSSYIRTYIEKDVRQIINIQDEASFIKFMRAVAALSGQQLNYVTLAEVAGKDVTTVKNWLSALQTSGLVYLLEPYYNNFNKRLTKTPKLYMMDTGLICYLGGWNSPEQLVNGAKWGHIFETYIITEVIKSFYNSGQTLLPLYYYRDKEKNEVDLLIEEAGTLYPVEIKTTSDPDGSMIKAFELLKKIPDKIIGEGAIICLAKDVLPIRGNNWIIPVDMV